MTVFTYGNCIVLKDVFRFLELGTAVVSMGNESEMDRSMGEAKDVDFVG